MSLTWKRWYRPGFADYPEGAEPRVTTLTITGDVVPGALEMSNVDLALEFTNMIIAQRTYQANAQTIKTQDQVLQTLINLR